MPTATFESAVPRGEGDTCRSLEDAPLPGDRDGGEAVGGYVFGVDGCSGWEVVEEGFEDTGEAAVVVAAFVVVAGVLATAAEDIRRCATYDRCLMPYDDVHHDHITRYTLGFPSFNIT